MFHGDNTKTTDDRAEKYVRLRRKKVYINVLFKVPICRL